MTAEASKIPVKDFMTKAIISIDASTGANVAAKMMEKAGVGSVIVTENNKPIGIVTERDFAVRVVAYAYPTHTKITQIMSSPIIHVTPNESILEVADLMATKKIRKIPVLENDDVIGIITATDMLHLFTLLTEEDFKKVYSNFLTKIYEQNIAT